MFSRKGSGAGDTIPGQRRCLPVALHGNLSRRLTSVPVRRSMGGGFQMSLDLEVGQTASRSMTATAEHVQQFEGEAWCYRLLGEGVE